MSSNTEALTEQVSRLVGMAVLKNDKNYAWDILELIQAREATLKAEYDEKIREAQKQGYIDGIKSDERSTDEVITRSTIRALDDIELYALDCTFGTSWESKHVEKAVPIKSIESRIEYFKSTLSAQKKELEQDE